LTLQQSLLPTTICWLKWLRIRTTKARLVRSRCMGHVAESSVPSEVLT
jgi:hypothetical protein